MTIHSHILGYPRIGAARELKFALEHYWQGKLDQAQLIDTAQQIEHAQWQDQIDAGLSILTIGDFVYYDHILTHAVRLGVLPARFAAGQAHSELDRQFYLARGRAAACPDVAALEMTKWFDTNYHYLVPELSPTQTFTPDFSSLYDQVIRAKTAHPEQPIKVVLTGLLSFLYLSRVVGKAAESQHHHHDAACCTSNTVHQQQLETLDFVEALLPIYQEILDRLAQLGVAYVQLDEPILVLDLPQAWQSAFERVYHRLQRRDLKLIVASYFGTLGQHLHLAVNLPVAGLHIDVSREQSGEQFWQKVIDQLPTHKILSLGLVDGRGVWASDAHRLNAIVAQAYSRLQDRLWVGSSCSLLHVPVDLRSESVPNVLTGRLCFARQKLDEIAQLAQGRLQAQAHAVFAKDQLEVQPQVREGAFEQRFAVQQARFELPLLPTTTIGSFPQTSEIRAARAAWKRGDLGESAYQAAMQAEIRHAIEVQEELGLDVLVHGEAERTDMVEYFASLLEGFWVSQAGWVQSYGSRCVRPPIIVGDISRPNAMTVAWISYAQSLTRKVVKGMLTGPVTILNWSFPPAHRSKAEVALQIAEAIRLEVADLQAAGIGMIQIDEAAFREGLPLRQADQAAYWAWAVTAFKHCASSAQLATQIHTHMCYSDFNDCLPQITAMDADVITIETSRSGLQLLDAFEQEGYPNAVGPGVYDIHSPRTPDATQMQVVIDRARQVIPLERLWINPDCGLKTRQWPETKAALAQMVKMAVSVRERLGVAQTV
jgi:5-methyltetrahydropteroyltriglutamate--homocysteine methyltransferase